MREKAGFTVERQIVNGRKKSRDVASTKQLFTILIYYFASVVELLSISLNAA